MGNSSNSNSEKLPIGKFFAWKSRDVSVACVTVVAGYISIFCTDTLGMPTALVGTIMFVSKLFDVLTDLIAGYAVDNTRTKWGKGRPYELCIIGSWLSTVLLFFCPANLEMAAKTIWVFVTYTLVFSVFNTFLGAAQNPYMIRAFRNKAVISKIASYGGIITMLGSAVVSVTFPMLMAKLATSSAGWRSLILIYAVPLTLIGLLRVILVKEDQSIDAGKTAQRVNLKHIFTMFRKNKYTWAYAGIMGCYNLVVGINVSTFYFKYIVKDISILGIINIMSIILLPVMVFFPKLMKKMSVAQLIQTATGISMVGYVILFFARANITLLIIGNILIALATLPIAYLGVVIIMELATYNEWLGLSRMEGSTNIVSNFATKAFNGIGVGVQGIVLSIFGYVSSEGATVQSQTTLMAIRSLYSWVPFLCYIGIIVCAGILGRLEKRLPAIEKEVEERRKAE